VVFDSGGWRKKLAGLGLLGLVATGCINGPEMQYPETQVASRRLAALPTEALAWTYDFYGTRTLDQKRSLEIKRNIDDSITYRVRRRGGRSFTAASIEELPHAQAFRGWAVDTLTEIVNERVTYSNAKHESVGDWRFPHRLSSWRSRLDADFVLITLFLDGHNTAGRAVAVAVGGGSMAARRAIGRVVHLQSSRVVWCNLDDMTQELDQRFGAQEEVDRLLDEMLSQGEKAPLEAPPARSSAARIAPAADVPPPPPPPPLPPGPDTPARVHFHGAVKPSKGTPP